MKLQLPPRVSAKTMERALSAFAGVVGSEWVLATDDDRETYCDVYQPSHETRHKPAAAVAPQSLEEVRGIVRLANEHKVPLWPISRGKNFGYGGSAPVLSGTVILDLSRMNRILDVDVKRAFCLLEPGVSFFQLHDYLQEHGIPLWVSAAANSWGSVLGNALERGVGYTPYGENTAQLCGLEVLLPDGELIRTGMGAMTNGKASQIFRYGYGPSWDQMFVQSNFGIVTRGGMWLMPEPEATLALDVTLPEPPDIIWVLDALSELRLNRTIDSKVTIGNYMRVVSMIAQRNEWYQGEGSMPEPVIREMLKKYGLGWWNFTIPLYGYEDVVRANGRRIVGAFGDRLATPIKEKGWRRGEPIEQSAMLIPTVTPLHGINWWGGRGGHMGFSPILPINGEEAYAQFESTRRRYQEFGLDHYGGFTLDERYITNVNQIIYDRDNEDLTRRAHGLFDALIRDAKQAGYGEYRTHLTYMDQVAQTFDFNDHALLRLNEKVKDVLDPNGILAPGKSGIWPRAYRENEA